MLTNSGRDRIKSYWLTKLGLDPKKSYHGVNIVTRGGSAANGAIEIICLDGVTFISCNEDEAKRWNCYAHQARVSHDEITRTAKPGDQVLGPAILMYADALLDIPLELEPEFKCTYVAKEDPTWNNFECDLGPTAWEAFGFSADEAIVDQVAILANGRIVAGAYIENWGNILGHIGVATHPSEGGKGLGKYVVKVISQRALNLELMPQYRTLASNAPSLRLAKALGFVALGESYAILP